MKRLKIGLVVNPYAGIGGSTALKGSDGKAIREEALKRGAIQNAPNRAKAALTVLFEACGNEQEAIEWLAPEGTMGADLLRSFGVDPVVCYQPNEQQTEASDTQSCVQAFLEHGVDLILFAGGDGTARDLATVIKDQEIPVIGIPAGVKIHSGVYAIHPRAAGQVASMVVSGQLTTVRWADVMDIDETAFRQGTVRAKRYGELMVPSELEYMQAVKVGGKESDELVLTDIADDIIESMEPGHLYIMGSGSTVAAIMERLGVENTLLGVDAVCDEKLVGQDLSARELVELKEQYPETHLVITLIGGQGHLLGRGNQQLSPELLRLIDRSNVHIVATKEKLKALNGRPLIVDSGQNDVDDLWAGLISVVTGYHDRTMVTIAAFNRS
ncbi:MULTISPECIES: ATP-NAD kinase family protein [Gammaproteobacteria]|uniref:ATP-NAD kinase family protein n=1 Tax=Gammaproteobacteria TaxID=1236 RepID=UPI000DCFBE08|nr:MULTISPECIES: ATP-NAD kinase family protein [Gammaproteobacteria]RTE87389.1 ATP-NAD kinase [Aliidiomarina sp. B3213]TCZ92825.1 ATP-NAD kinase [Lysobacter sp. N42]